MASSKSEYEEAFGKQIETMKNLFDTEYFEIWIGDDGYDIATPQTKIYDSDSANETEFQKIFGRSIESLDNLIVERACASSFAEDFYEERTGHPYPKDMADKYGLSSVIIITLGIEGTRNRIKLGRFASK